MGLVRNIVFGDFACIGTDREFVLVIKNKIYDPLRIEAMLRKIML